MGAASSEGAAADHNVAKGTVHLSWAVMLAGFFGWAASINNDLQVDHLGALWILNDYNDSRNNS